MMRHTLYFTMSSEGLYVAWLNDQMLAVGDNKFDCAKKAADKLVELLNETMQVLEEEKTNK